MPIRLISNAALASIAAFSTEPVSTLAALIQFFELMWHSLRSFFEGLSDRSVSRARGLARPQAAVVIVVIVVAHTN